jgi:dTDP-4-amino-4,6-dideoxygalactose transaminase
MIPFNKPYLTGKETHYIYQAVSSGKISGNGVFTKKCQAFLEAQYGFTKTLLTTSCTDALEMISLLLRLQPGDEVIMPSYTFVSTANAFLLRGVRIRFADSYAHNPNIDPACIEPLITPQTKALVVVHYAGIACDMDAIMALAKRHNLYVIEDAAQAIDAYYKGQALGSIGHLGAFSFHETKNIIAGEGGALLINDQAYTERAEIIWEKGTNRAAFFRGEINKYGWVDIGSSFLPADTVAAFLYAQLENIDLIQAKRKQIWQTYQTRLQACADAGFITLPQIPEYATHNAHLFYLVCASHEVQAALLAHLKKAGILAVFHYLSLHKSSFFETLHDGRALPNSDKFSNCLVRLPLFYELSEEQVDYIVTTIQNFFFKK